MKMNNKTLIIIWKQVNNTIYIFKIKIDQIVKQVEKEEEIKEEESKEEVKHDIPENQGDKDVPIDESSTEEQEFSFE